MDIIDAFTMMEDICKETQVKEDFSESDALEAVWSSRGVSTDQLYRVTSYRATFIAGNSKYHGVGAADAIEAGLRQGFLAGVLYERNRHGEQSAEGRNGN